MNSNLIIIELYDMLNRLSYVDVELEDDDFINITINDQMRYDSVKRMLITYMQSKCDLSIRKIEKIDTITIFISPENVLFFVYEK